ncbi:hypothetical protein M427DRAFT_124394 [Gonapodya prolifera JEL478]|uniref:Bacterial surface antigen (D15) domain-containing protein n=1 Tax=Gonapodya prolifera (strain JEL478) TaxID=1344416 RepID=A0A139ACJ9_GONPJ|nr:hypothetical protein M427DRAFT_124394 [Gonapodya prolifera JEL478]|eukprot:KXS14304.1 hypothetical protein M427DRAFT_124394 [Gonapodya prolifera JEL478]
MGDKDSHPSAEDINREITNLILESRPRPFSVESVRVSGQVHTKPWVFSSAFGPFYSSKTLGGVLSASQTVHDRLARLGIFSEVDIGLDASPTGGDAVDVVLRVKERPRLFIKTGTEIGTSDGSLTTSVNVRNVFGGAETIHGSAVYGMETDAALSSATSARDASFASSASTAFTLVAAKPLWANPDHVVEVGVGKSDKSQLRYSSFVETETGLTANYKTLFPLGTAEVGYSSQWRHVHNLSSNASMSIRSSAGHTLKSALHATLSHDVRDDPVLPTSGHAARVTAEVAHPSLGGDVVGAKVDGELSLGRKLGHGFSVQAGLRAGLLVPLAGYTTRVNDRWFLGGPTTVRGFRHHGIGPKDGEDALGGDAFWAAGVSLFTPVPWLGEGPIKGHLFANVGGLGILKDGPTAPALLDLVSNPSASAGAGIAVRFSIARLELNYCLPLAMRRGDDARVGWQLGLGVQFL